MNKKLEKFLAKFDTKYYKAASLLARQENEIIITPLIKDMFR